MTTTEFTMVLPGSFGLVPGDASSEFQTWADDVAARSVSPSIRTHLSCLAAAIDASTEPDRRWFAVIPPVPYRGGIAAFGWVRAASADGTTAAELEEQVGAGPPNSTSFVTDLSLHVVGTLPALVIHQFQPVEARDSSMLVERCGVLVLDEARNVAINLEIAAVDLRAFRDLVATSLEIVSSVAFEEAVA